MNREDERSRPRDLRGVSCKAWKEAEIGSIRAEAEVIDAEVSTTYATRVLIRTNIKTALTTWFYVCRTCNV
jgi:hypothetical protein